MPRFAVKNLRIDKMPGFPSGIPVSFEFSPRINIIHGDNATGKSSLARAISTLFWHENKNDYHLRSNVKIDQTDDGEIEIGYGRIQVKNGIILKDADQLKQPVNNKSLYALSLESMINEKETGIAQVILKESNGGFDLNKIISDQERQLCRITTGNKLYSAYQQAKEKLETETTRQSKLTTKESDIQALNVEIEACNRSLARQEGLKKILEWIDAKDDLKAVNTTFDGFHPDHAKLKGGEEILLKDALEKKYDAENKYKDEQRKRDHSADTIKSLGLPEEGLDLVKLDVIQQKLSDWKTIRNRTYEYKAELNGLLEKRHDLLHVIGEDTDPADLEPPGREDIEALEELIRRQLNLNNHRQAIQEQIRQTEKQLQKLETPAWQLHVIAPATEAIQRWLQMPQSQKQSSSRKLFLGAAVALLLVVGLVLWFGKSFVLLALFIIITLFYFGGKETVQTPNMLRQPEIDRLLELGMDIPSNPTPQSMTSLLKSLLTAETLYESRNLLEGQVQWLERDLHQSERSIQDANSELSVFCLRMNNVPAFQGSPSPTYILRFIKAWMDWHQHSAEIREVEGRLRTLEQQAIEIEGDCRQHFEAIQQPFSRDITLLTNQLEALKTKENKRKQLVDIYLLSLQNMESFADQIKLSDRRIAEIILPFCPEHRSLQGIHELQTRHREYLDTDSRLRELQVRVDSLYRQLPMDRETGLFDDGRCIATRETIEEQLADAREQAEKRDSLRDRLSSIHSEIQRAREGHELEILMADRDAALAGLDGLLDDHLDALGMKAVSDLLIETTDTESRPEVLNKAGDYFGRFTHGRYRLHVTTDDEGKFVVWDDATHRRQELSELSAATKLQLILAVRLAYISQIEHGLVLPLLVDEVMMNSDDGRAQAIMQMLVAISAERQVFYFTASKAEAGHWKSILAAVGDAVVDHRFIGLGVVNDRVPAMLDAIENPFRLTGSEVPSSVGYNHASYGLRINPPHYNLLISNTDQLHVWYLVEDPTVVEKLLRLQIRNWRVLCNVWEQTRDIPEIDGAEMERYTAMVGILSRFQELYRIGRNKPINEEVLKASGAVSDKFMERAVRILHEHQGDPAALLISIDNKKLEGFRSKSRADLQQYLTDQGYLSEEEPTDMEEIRAQVLLQAERSGIGREMLDRFFERVLG